MDKPEFYMVDYDMGNLTFMIVCERGATMADILNGAVKQIEAELECLIEAITSNVEHDGRCFIFQCYQSTLPRGENDVLLQISPVKIVQVNK